MAEDFKRPMGVDAFSKAVVGEDREGRYEGTGDDHELLLEFEAHASSRVFSALTERYAGLVYGVALRRIGRPELAEEVTQDVFAILARKAAAVARKRIPLAAWLHRAAVLESSQSAHRESRRQQVMKDFATHHELTTITKPVAPLDSMLTDLDDALDRLPQSDREVILARYFERRTYGELSARTGKSEAALMQQHHRALEKLSRFFQRRGHRVTAATLAAGMSAPLASAAPPGLAAACATSAAASSALGGTTSTAFHLSLAMQNKSHFAMFATCWCLIAGSSGFVAARWHATARNGNDASMADRSQLTSEGNSTGSGAATVQPSPRMLDLPQPTMADVLAADGRERLELLARWLPSATATELEAMLERISASEESTIQSVETALIIQRWVEVDRPGAFAAARKVKGNGWLACQALGRIDPEAAWAAAQSMDSYEITNILRGIAEADPWLAHELLLSGQGKGRHPAFNVEDSIAEFMARKDPKRALEFAWMGGGSLVAGSPVVVVMREWARSDPDGAIEHALGLTSPRQRSEAIPALAMGLFDRDPEKARGLLEALPEGRVKWQCLADHARALASSDPDAALSFLGATDSAVGRTAMAQELAHSWAQSRPEMALGLLRDLDWRLAGEEWRMPEIATPDSSPHPPGISVANNSLSELAEAGFLDPALVVAEAIPHEAKRAQALDAVVAGWPADRVYDLSKWLSTQDDPAIRETGARRIVATLMADEAPDFEAAARWAAILPVPVVVEGAPLVEVMRKWRDKDPAAVAAAMDELAVSEAVRNAVEAATTR